MQIPKTTIPRKLSRYRMTSIVRQIAPMVRSLAPSSPPYSKKGLFDLYEKIYFHEIDVREKLAGRLQMPMAIIVSLVGVLAFLLQNFEKQHTTCLAIVFVILIVSSICVLCVAVFLFVRSWYGNEYSFIPSARDTEKYLNELKSTYADYENGNEIAEKYFIEYLRSYYIECSTKNAVSNDTRTLALHRTNGAVICATILIFFSFLAFYFGNLEKSKFAKPTEVKIVNPFVIRGDVMKDTQPEVPKSVTPPPPPPPPPPARVIREGVEIVKPQLEKKNDR